MKGQTSGISGTATVAEKDLPKFDVGLIGSFTSKVVPLPTSDSREMLPPCACTTACTIARPRPAWIQGKQYEVGHLQL